MLYEERKVEGDDSEYYEESEQQVILLQGAEDKQDVDIMGADEVSPAVWSLGLLDCKDGKCPPSEQLMAQPSSEGPPDPSLWRKVVFTDYSVAIRLQQRLRTHPTDGFHAEIGHLKFNYPLGSKETQYSSLKPSKVKGNECEKKRTPPVKSSIPKEGTPSAESQIRRYSKHVTSARRLDAKPLGIPRQ